MAEAATTPGTKIEFAKFGRKQFSPGMYMLHWDNIEGIPLELNGERSTLDALYAKFAHSTIKDEPETLGLRHKKYVTDAGDIEIEAEWTILSAVGTLAGLFKQGIEALVI